MFNVKGHDSTIRKRLNKYGLLGKVARRNISLKRTCEQTLIWQSCKVKAIASTMNSSVSKNFLKSTIRSSVKLLELGHGWVLQQNSDPKHSSMSTREQLKEKRIKVSQSKSSPQP